MHSLIKNVEDEVTRLQKYLDNAVFPKSGEQQHAEQEIRKTLVFLKNLILKLITFLPNK